MCRRISMVWRRAAVALAAAIAGAGADPAEPQATAKVGAVDVAPMIERSAALRAGGEYAKAIESGR
jgi:hypothetical protein